MDINVGLIVAVVLALVVLGTLARAVRIVPQATARPVERLGKYSRTLEPGLNVVVPFVDRVRSTIDLREQVVTFPPQSVITKDNLVVGIDTVIYFQVTDPRAATYEIFDYIQAIEQLSVTTLRNAIGNLALEATLTSRDSINSQLGTVLDEATGKWGIKVNRVELKAIEPPLSIKDSMEKSMRADRDKRAAILTAEGQKSAEILAAEGRKQAMILRAEGDAQAAVLRANGEADAVRTVYAALHDADIDERLLTYKYLDKLPEIASGAANKVWFVPSDMPAAFSSLAVAASAVLPEAAPKAPQAATNGSARQQPRDVPAPAAIEQFPVVDPQPWYDAGGRAPDDTPQRA